MRGPNFERGPGSHSRVQIHHDLVAVPGLDRGEETRAVGHRPRWTSLQPRLGGVALAPATREIAQPSRITMPGMIGFASDQLDSLVVGGQDIGPSIAGHVDHLDGVQTEARGQISRN